MLTICFSSSSIGRLVIFIVFPLLIGCIALLTALAQKQRNPEYEINVDRDFFYPVTLGLALCIIVGFQTRGYATSKPEPLVAWPKVYKRKKIVHQYVGKGKAEAKED